MVTARCPFQEFKRVPTEETTLLVLFHLAEAAMRYEIEIHDFCVMSNPYPIVFTDEKGVLPDFLRDLNSSIARVLN